MVSAARPLLPDPASAETSAWTARQAEVLDAALDLLIAKGAGFSMGALASAASCSKETLYRWFSDRDGLLTAIVRRQASKVTVPALPAGALTRDGLRAALEAFATSWLEVITGDVSIALNRLAIAQDHDGLGRIVLENGPKAMAARLEPILDRAHDAGLVRLDDPADAFTLFFGLVVGDLQTRLLLGDDARPSPVRIKARARLAATRFLTLVGTPDSTGPTS